MMKRLAVLFVVLTLCLSGNPVSGQEGSLTKEGAEKVILRCFNEVKECQGEDFFAFEVFEIDASSIALVEMFIDGESQGKAHVRLVKKDNLWKIFEISMDRQEWLSFEEQLIPSLKETCAELKKKKGGEAEMMQNPVQTTIEDLEGLGFIIMTWIEDTGKAPQADSLEKAAEIIKEYYSFHKMVDVWGNAFLYKEEGGKYWVASAGSDGKFDGFDQTGRYDMDDAKDIIYSNGEFTFRPKEK